MLEESPKVLSLDTVIDIAVVISMSVVMMVVTTATILNYYDCCCLELQSPGI